MKRLKKIVLLLIVNGLVLLTLLFVVEYVFRYLNAFPQTGVQRYIYERFIDLKEFVPSEEVSSYSQKIKAIEIKDLEVQLPCRADSNGLLPSHKKGAIQSSIIILGDAQTCNLNLPDNERIHQVIFQDLDSSFQVLNAAFPGCDMIHSTNKLVNVLLPLRPKAALINHNLTDLLILAKHGSYWSQIVGDKKIARVWTTPFTQEAPIQFVEDSAVLQDFSRAMRNLGQLLQSWHIKPVFFTQAINHSDSTAITELLQTEKINLTSHRLFVLHQRINQEIIEICNENEWAFIDIEKEIGSEPSYFNNYLLLNSNGVQKVSRQIADSLENWVLFTKRK